MTGNKGFALFYALLVSSLALAIGAAIYDITLREIDLASSATQSQYSVYMADSAGECALYWDSKYRDSGGNALNGGSGSAFATSSTDTQFATSNIICDGVDIAAVSIAASTWPLSSTAAAATTTFNLTGAVFHNQTPCAYVTVAKVGNPAQTTVTAHGYNTCAAGAIQLERVFQITY